MERRGSIGAGILGAIAVALFVSFGGGDRAETNAGAAPDGDATSSRSEEPRADGGDLPPVTASRAILHPTLWLCGYDADEGLCDEDLDATVVAADGSRRFEPFTPASDPEVDCFYVYPTVSDGDGGNAPLEITDAERDVVRAQAARFGQICQVIAPTYRQVTWQAVARGGLNDPELLDVAYADVLSAWNDHVARSGDRPFVLLGHSQGVGHLVRLITERIEGDPELRPRLVSALLIGGDVTIPADELDAAPFETLPPCSNGTDTRCVVAYNSFTGTPPPGTLFGRGGHGTEVLCVHPGALGGGSAPLTPVLPLPADHEFGTPFVVLEGFVEAGCRSEDQLSWLQVDIDPAIAFDLEAASSARGLPWGLHIIDVNVALQDLIDLVRRQAETITSAGGS